MACDYHFNIEKYPDHFSQGIDQVTHLGTILELGTNIYFSATSIDEVSFRVSTSEI
jgi:hypothetical protein